MSNSKKRVSSFSHKEFPFLSRVLSYYAGKGNTKPFLWVMLFYDALLSIGKLKANERLLYKKMRVIRFMIFASLYFDNGDIYLVAQNFNIKEDDTKKVIGTFNLMLHFKDEFPALTSPPYRVFSKINQRNPYIAEHYMLVYLNKYATVSNHSRSRHHNATYFKHLFDIAIKLDLIDEKFINKLFLTIVTQGKEYMFDLLDNDGFVFEATGNDHEEFDFITKLLRMKGKDPYQYMTYCNPHYHSFCLQLLS